MYSSPTRGLCSRGAENPKAVLREIAKLVEEPIDALLVVG